MTSTKIIKAMHNFIILSEMILGAGGQRPIFVDGCVVRSMLDHIEEVGASEFLDGELDSFVDDARSRYREMTDELTYGGCYSHFPVFQLKTTKLIRDVIQGDVSIFKACETFAMLRNDFYHNSI